MALTQQYRDIIMFINELFRPAHAVHQQHFRSCFAWAVFIYFAINHVHIALDPNVTVIDER